jgi:sigma-B regulation protein RsbU (phosphoserine phosphatase)
MSGTRAARPAPADPLRQLDHALSALHPEVGTEELAGQVVDLVAAQRGVAGARLWHLDGDSPRIWRESGSLPAADPAAVQKWVADRRAPKASGESCAWVLARDSVVRSVLEAHFAGPLPNETRSLLDLIRRYAELALISSERRHAAAELLTVVEAAKRLNSTLDLGELITLISQIATQQTGADRAIVLLFDRGRDELWAPSGAGPEQQEIRLPAGRGIAGRVAHQGEAVNLADAYHDPRFDRDVDRQLGYRTRTLLCLPIRRGGGEIIGVLRLLNKQGGEFTAGDEGLLLALTDHVALALENALLHREQLAKEHLERDLSLARRIQAGFLPEKTPQLAGFDFAATHRTSPLVGGDYYSFLPLGPETLLAVIADVEGKGVGSALVMANLHATLHALFAHVHSIERIVGSLNDRLLADLRGQKSVTLFLALLDQRHRVLHYVNAGHVPPAVVRPDGVVEQLREGGMVLGMFPGVAYERGHVRLLSGDIFVGFTDGITRARDAQGNEYGMGRLAAAVHRARDADAIEIVESAFADTEQFSKGGPQEDDRVLLVLKTR